MLGPSELHTAVQEAVMTFWRTRDEQGGRQGDDPKIRDRGARAKVTGGKHMDGFVRLVCRIAGECGIEEGCIFQQGRTELPGWFRSEKSWDTVIVVDGRLIASIELKSQVGSFGNNFNNRTEEALGCATDLLAAYREGAFSPSAKPWLGYILLLEDAPRSRMPVKPKEPHFAVFKEFQGASYQARYGILLQKMVRERLYDAACLVTSPATAALDGAYSEPAMELSFERFIESLRARLIAAAGRRP